MRLPYLLIIILVTLLLLAWQFPGAVASTDDRMRILYMLMLLALIAGGAGMSRLEPGTTARHAATWLAIIVVLVLLYQLFSHLFA